MKKTISVYIIVGFLLSSFAGCGKLKNIVGLNQSETPALRPLSKVGSKSDTSNPPVQTFEPSTTSIKDLTGEEILERFQREVEETLERELMIFNLMDILRLSCNADVLQVVVNHRNDLVDKLLEMKGSYYKYIKESKY